MLGGPFATSKVSAETLYPSPDQRINSARENTANTAPYSNPYRQRRMLLKAPAQQQQAAPQESTNLEPIPSVIQVPRQQAASEPLKIVVPNLQATRQGRTLSQRVVTPSSPEYARLIQTPTPALLPETARSSSRPANADTTSDDIIAGVVDNLPFLPKKTMMAIRKIFVGNMTYADASQRTLMRREPITNVELQNAALTPEKLAQLTPSAGEAENAAPLIPTPPPVAAAPPAPATQPALTPLIETPAAPAAVTAAPAIAAPIAEPAPVAVAPVSEPAAPVQEAPPVTVTKTIEMLPDLKESTSNAMSAAPETQSTEPAQELSKQSKTVLKKLPSNMDKKKKQAVEKLDIDHSKEASQELTEGVTKPSEEIAKHEMMGMKIQVKKQQANINYDLDRAYGALLSGNTEAAIEIYRNVLTNDPNNKNALFGLATTYHRAGQIDMARPLYAKLLTINPSNRDALNNFLVLVADEAPQAAIEELEKLESRNPDFSPIPAQMAVIYQKMGNVDKASEKMFRAIQLSPENLTYRYNLAIMLDKQRNYEEASKLYRQLLEAERRGQAIPGNAQKIQERLTFISSNRP